MVAAWAEFTDLLLAVGSIQVGKLGDGIALDADRREGGRDTRSVPYLTRNGVLCGEEHR